VYLITGLTQGDIGTFDVQAIANSATELSGEVAVYPSGVVNGWVGVIDWTDCQLTRLLDEQFNDVSGKTNISNFPWGNPRATNNKIDSASVFTVSTNWPLAGDSLANNVIIKSVVDINDGNDQISFQHNFIENSNVTVLTNSNGVDVNIRSNSVITSALNFTVETGEFGFSGNSVLNNSALTFAPEYSLTFDDNHISSQCTLTINGTGTSTLTFRYSEIKGLSTVTLTPALNRLLSISSIIVADQSALTLTSTWAAGSAVVIEKGSILNGSTIVCNGLLAADVLTVSGFHIMNLSTLSLLMDSNARGGIVINAALENAATLTPDGFTTFRIRLEDLSSILVANINDATASGYVNALP
jgi:hypothetical protein